jgi:hypothetical protein
VRKPRHQVAFTSLLYVLAGYGSLGVFLDATGNSLSLLNDARWTYLGTFVAGVLWLAAELVPRWRPVTWVSGGIDYRVTRAPAKIRLGLVGAICLLWVPRLVDAVAPPPPITSVSQPPQPPVVLAGRVVDAQSRNSIGVATVAASGFTSPTQENGNFRIVLDPAMRDVSVVLKATKAGYRPHEATVVPPAEGILILLAKERE